ncbi:hypothetical protein KY320_01530 [Candidatus Woesearchaeota archaeon]|nr:hypothetical protein [Candidatus Woesearchaeota archaeon]
MGMYSYFVDEEDIEIKDLEGLKNFLKVWKDKYGKEKWWWKIYEEDSLLVECGKETNFTFESWTEMKLISYWYTPNTVFLHCLGKYLKGYVRWNFETDDEAGWVEFTDKGTVIHSGQMMWSTWDPLDVFKFKMRIDGKDEEDKKEYYEEILFMENL